MIDWGYLFTLIGIALGVWFVIALVGALLVGGSIRLADRQEGTDDESPDPWEAGPDSRQ